MDGKGIASRDGQTESGASVGDAAHAHDCVTLPRAANLRPIGLGRLGQVGVMLRALGDLPRPESWLPYVFTSPEEAAEADICELSSVSWYGKR